MHNSLRIFAFGSVIPRAGCLEQVTCCCDLCAKVCIIIINFIIIVIVSIFVEIFCVVCANEKTPKCIAWQLVFDVCSSFQVTVYLENFNKIPSSPTFECCFWFNCQLMVRAAFTQGQEFEIHFFNVLFLLNTLYLDNSWIFSCSDPTCR